MKISLNSMKNLTIDEIVSLYRLGYRIETLIDPVVNFGKVTVSTGYNNSATSIILITGDGSKLPNPSTDGPFNLTWYDSADYSDPSDDPLVEIVRCTGKSGDTLTILRGQEGTSASNKNTVGKTYKMVLSPTKKTIGDIQSYAQSRVDAHASLTASIHNFDGSGNAPPQLHGLGSHTGTIGTWGQIDKTTSSIADITTRSHSSLTDGTIPGTTNSHTAIDTAITNYASHIAATSAHGTTGNIMGYGNSRIKVGQFSRDISLASGNQTITGVGFQPVAIIFISVVDSVTGQASWGFLDASSGVGITDHGAVASDQYQLSGAINIQTGSANSYVGTLSSFNADGFTIAWTKNGGPTGTVYVNYLAIR